MVQVSTGYEQQRGEVRILFSVKYHNILSISVSNSSSLPSFLSLVLSALNVSTEFSFRSEMSMAHHDQGFSLGHVTVSSQLAITWEMKSQKEEKKKRNKGVRNVQIGYRSGGKCRAVAAGARSSVPLFCTFSQAVTAVFAQ